MQSIYHLLSGALIHTFGDLFFITPGWWWHSVPKRWFFFDLFLASRFAFLLLWGEQGTAGLLLLRRRLQLSLNAVLAVLPLLLLLLLNVISQLFLCIFLNLHLFLL